MYAGSDKSNAEADDLTLNIRANIYLSKIVIETAEKGLENVQSSQ